MSEIEKSTAQVAIWDWDKDTILRAVEKPLSLLPADWRGPVWGFWAKWASLLRSQLDLAATLREWIAEDGLTLDEAQEAFRAVCRPERRAAVQFPGQVVGELAKEVARLVAARKAREERERRQREEQESRERSDPDGVHKALSERIAAIGCGGAR